MESINLQLLNRVAKQYSLVFTYYEQETEDGDNVYVSVDDGGVIDSFRDINEAFVWFKGYEKGNFDGSPFPNPAK